MSVCAGKEKFASHALAERVARRQAKKYGRPFSAYYCRHCEAFHSGSRLRKTTGVRMKENK